MSDPAGTEHPGRGWFIVLFMICAVVAATARLVDSHVASYLLSGCMLGLAWARSRLPAGKVGPLVVRSRSIDVALMVGFAVALALLTMLLPDV